MSIVLDTNVLLAAFIARGVCAELLEHCVTRHELITSEHILDEFQKHLLGKFKFSPQETTEALVLLRSRMKVIEPIALARPVCRDPNDDLVLAIAVAANARCLITGDKDLLVLVRYTGVEIVAPSAFADFEAEEAGTMP
jgi:putative PIN family toxin of toxin-antitoxin system